jgi:hypothetical protein
VATVFVTKPFNRNGLNKRDNETVQFWMLYQALAKVDPIFRCSLGQISGAVEN